MPPRPASAILLAFAAIYIIWGTTFLGIALVLRSMPPFLSGSVRFLIAAGLLYAWLRVGDAHPFAGLHRWGTALCGVLLTGMGNGLVIWSQTALPSGVTALFIAVLPVLTLVFDWAFFSRRRPTAASALGVLLGFAGIAVLALNMRALSGAVRPLHVLAVLGAEVAWAFGTLLQRRYAPADRVVAFTCLQMFAGALFQLLMALIDREWIGFNPAHVTLQSALALAYLIVFGSIIAFNSYSFLVAQIPAQKITTYALVNPVIALALGAWLLGEKMTLAALAACALVLAGVALVLFPNVLRRSASARLSAPAELEN